MKISPFHTFHYPKIVTNHQFFCKLLLIVPKEHLDRQETIIDDLKPLFDPIQRRHLIVNQLLAV